MSIQNRVSVALLIVVVLFVGVSYYLLSVQFVPAFQSLEIRAASANVARAERALHSEVNQLSQAAGDWATWDSAHRFALGENNGFIEDNLNAQTFKQLDIDIVMFLDSGHDLKWGMIFNEDTTERNLLAELSISDTASSALLTHTSTRSVAEGIAWSRFGPLIVSARPIVRNESAGPIAGTLIFGKFLDADHVASLRDRTEVDLSILSMRDVGFRQLKQSSSGRLSADQWQQESSYVRDNYIVISDVANEPQLVLHVRTPRDISRLGNNALTGAIVSLILLVGLVGLVMLVLLRRIVVQPLTKLTRHVTKLNTTGDMTSRLEFDEQGEIGHLALAFSTMQEALLDRENKFNDSVQKLEYQANHDALTGLHNRRTLYKQLKRLSEQLPGSDATCCVCILDLDRFKIVNDTSGHAAGDALLVQIATLLSESVYTTDTKVRLGGDEFALLLHDCSGDVAIRICEQIRERIESLSFCWEGVQHRIGVSIGILSVSTPGESVSEILQRADAACFAAKEGGRNQVHLVSDREPAVDAKRQELHWVQRLSTAIDQDQFLLFTQAIVPLQESAEPERDRLEVLIRLRNYATNKLVPPGAFVPSAERYKLSAKIDQWVVSQIVRYTYAYDHVLGDDRMYWVNLSGASLADERFTSFLESTVKNARFPPGRLNFEITESFAIQNVSKVADFMRRLKDLGCEFALDDFGAGFSSFNYLQSLPISCLKIDGLIVRNILDSKVDRMFVKSIIDIAHTMNVATVAEFVESDELARELAALGADYGQGFALGRPEEIKPVRIEEKSA